MKHSVKLSVKGGFFLNLNSLSLILKKIKKKIVSCQLKDIFCCSSLAHETELLIICSTLWIGYEVKKTVEHRRLSFSILLMSW